MSDQRVPSAFSSRLALVGWAVAAIGGTAAVWWLSTYLESLTALAQTDRGAALELFRTRAMPALLLVVGVAVAAGAVLLRQGLQMARADGREGRFLGNMIATAGSCSRPSRSRSSVLFSGFWRGRRICREVAAPRSHLS